MNNGTCSVEGCVKPIKRGGFCYAHYMKNWRYGTPTPVHPPSWVDIRGKRFGTLVVVERVGSAWRCVCDCGEERITGAGGLNREGDSNTCGVEGRHLRADIGYGTAHDRVRKQFGSATGHQCVDCDAPAAQWSYNHDDPNEMFDHKLSARPIAYSADPLHYSPRCVPCHKRFDLDRVDAA